MIGAAAEDVTRRKYLQSGFELERANYRVPGLGEIDLIMRAGQKLYFIECKSGQTSADAAALLSNHQRDRMHQTALHFLEATGRDMNCDMRFDAAFVDRQGSVSVIPGALN
ncbi:MAG: YraN family protein [Pseudomonadota bacterium]